MTKPKVSVSLVILTWNRARAVEESLTHNLQWSGHHIDEIIHVDNGSEPGFADWFRGNFNPDVQIINRSNLGVAKGYNRGLALATGTHLVITGCDRVMPRNWLLSFLIANEAIPNTGAISLYSEPYDQEQHRYQGPEQMVNGVLIRPADICEARFHSKEFLFGVGYFREDFGLYGFEDCEWRDRAHKFSSENKLLNYVLPALGPAQHLDYGNELGSDMLKMKFAETSKDYKRKLVKWCHENNSPHYNPYARTEKSPLSAVFEQR